MQPEDDDDLNGGLRFFVGCFIAIGIMFSTGLMGYIIYDILWGG